MDRYAVFIDAGYLLAAGQWALTGTFRSRSQFTVHYPRLVEAIKKAGGEAFPDKELLRVYWYDAAPGRVPTADHTAISYLDDVTVRLGTLTSRFVQKGVDALVILEMFDHALAGSITDAVLLAGDGDLVEGVSRAQSHGVRVTVWSFSTPDSTTSPDLRKAADRHRWFEVSRLAGLFETVELPDPEPGPPPAPKELSGTDRVEGTDVEALVEGAEDAAGLYARRLALGLTPAQLREILSSRPRVPKITDQALLQYTMEHLGLRWGDFLPYEATAAMRNEFFRVLDSLVAPG